MSDKPRILHAPIVALYQPWLYVEGLRAAGCEANYMCVNVREDDRWLMHSYDIDLALALDGSVPLSEAFACEMDFLLSAIRSYDVLHLHSGFGIVQDHPGLSKRLSELAFLKKLGKKIVMHWWGCDRRTEDVDGHYQYSACSECPQEERRRCRGENKRASFEWVDRYADIQITTGDLCASLDNIEWFNNAIDTDLWKPMSREEIPQRFRLPPTDNLRIYHSFGNSEIRGDVKGSRQIRQAFQRLRAEGLPVELMFFDRVPTRQLRFYQAQADIVVDQLRAGWHGSTAVECMACGKPVITYIRPEVEPLAPKDHPLIHATLETIYDVLKALVPDRDRLAEIGRKSREYALREHSHLVLGRRLLALYESL